jgi:hypothetical protein
VHIALLVVVAAMLPMAPSAGWKPQPGGEPTWRILALLAACLGLPYLALAATAPLLQAWLHRLHPGRSPYRLYALSNLASLLGLVSYPFVIEPALPRHLQALLWSAGLGGFILLSIGCAIITMAGGKLGEGQAPSLPPSAGATEEFAEVTASHRVLWLCLPALACVLLLATTNKICQDIAVVPFLWVLPLAVYLLSFIVCFDSPRWYRRKSFGPALFVTMGVIGSCSSVLRDVGGSIVEIGAYCAALFAACMVCHGELARLKPAPRHLTGYYLMIALGGAVGGALVALVAPLVFRDYYELPLGLLACAVAAMAAWRLDPRSILRRRASARVWGILIASLVVLGFLLLQPSSEQAGSSTSTIVGRWRNFYGVLTIWDRGEKDPKSHIQVLENGLIMHGLEFVDPTKRNLPAAYYAPSSGVGVTMRYFPRQTNRRIGVVGLGVGTIAGYAQPGDYLRFYEINPKVVELARTRFHFLPDCKGQVEVVLGDARLSMENEAPQDLDILVLDAFSGDAIPVHLLTRECFEMYLGHCREDAVIAVHISNRHLDLRPVMKKLAEHFGLRAIKIEDTKADAATQKYDSVWILLTRNDEFIRRGNLGGLVPSHRSGPGFHLWTDDETSLFPILH